MLSFTNATGTIFTRLGSLGYLIQQVGSYQAAQFTNLVSTTQGVVAQYNAESDIQAIIGQSYISALNSPSSSVLSLAQNMALQTINRMIFRDTPQLNQTLQSINTLASINEVIAQMKLAGATVLAMTVTATPSAFAPPSSIGNGVAAASVKRAFDGLVLENSYAETMFLTCTADSYTGGAQAGNETFAATGAGAEPGLLDFNWPLGSNGQQTITAINGSANNSQGNILFNSGYDAWTNNVPNGWTITVGQPGTNIFLETSITYDGAAALRLVGGASNTLTSWQQPFNSSLGTTTSLAPQTQYAFNVFMRRDGLAPASGSLVVELIDGNGNVILDNNGVANSETINLTTLSVNYAPFQVVFRTPTAAVKPYSIRYRLATPLTNGRAVYVDKGGMGLTTQVYTGGPSVAVFSGNVPFVNGDYATVVVTNSRGAGGTLNTWQTLLFRLFNSQAITNEILWPSAPVGSNTIADSWIFN